MAKQDSDIIYRYSEIDLAKVDRTARTIPISFSSEYPAMQRAKSAVAKMAGLQEGEAFVEILDHSPENVDLSILNNRGAFLDEHVDENQIGVIEKAEVTSEKRANALVKLGSDDQSVKRFTQMADNVRPHVSAGYKYTRYLGKEKLPNGRDAHRFAWRALEISSVAVPNDPTVGVGMGVARSYQDLPQIDLPKVVEEKISQKKFMAEKIEITEAQRSEIGNDVLSKDRARRSKLFSARDNFIKGAPSLEKEIRSISEKCDNENQGIDEFTPLAMAAFGARKLDGNEANIGMEKKDLQDYSLTRALRSAIDNGGKISNDCPEFDLSNDVAKKCGRTAGSFFIPNEVMTRGIAKDGRMTRDLQANVFGQGGATVPTFTITPIIELLRNKMVLRQLGIRVMGGLTGNAAIPRQTAAATAYSLSEIAQVAISTQVLDQITLTPKRVAATGNYSKQLLIQSSIDVENFMREDLMTVNAIRLDYLGFNGSGANSEPLGIINTAGVGSVVFGGAATYQKLVSFETQLNAANSMAGSRAYVTTPTAKGTLKSAAKFLTGGGTNVTNIALWEDDEINGYPAYDTNQILNNQMIFGNFDSLIMGMFGGLDIVVDPYTLADKGEVKITINNYLDFALRHPQEFVVSADAANQ